ncbi:MAG: hypothetical protein MZV65_18985 [Chromatiales bacterium]|nr:hypothetical protein [Chromatiales bacterium]
MQAQTESLTPLPARRSHETHACIRPWCCWWRSRPAAGALTPTEYARKFFDEGQEMIIKALKKQDAS